MAALFHVVHARTPTPLTILIIPILAITHILIHFTTRLLTIRFISILILFGVPTSALLAGLLPVVLLVLETVTVHRVPPTLHIWAHCSTGILQTRSLY
jgi:hypothetical protein